MISILFVPQNEHEHPENIPQCLINSIYQCFSDVMLSSSGGADYEYATSSSYQRGSSLVRESSPVGQTMVVEKRIIKRSTDHEEEEEEEE